MDIALMLAGASIIVAVIGTILSYRRALASEAIAKEALRDARGAQVQALWSDAIAAVLRIIGVDPAREPIGDQFRDVRVAITALVDGLDDQWVGIDGWLANEHTLGAALARQAMEQSKPNDGADERFKLLVPFMDWGAALSRNLRFLRRSGYDATAVEKLTAHAVQTRAELYARHGWGDPPTELKNLKPLDP